MLISLFPYKSRLAPFGNWGLLSLSLLSLLVASAITTIVQTEAVGIINKYGNGIGVYAYKGGKYLILTWTAVAVMFLAGAVEIVAGRKNMTTEYTRGLGRGLKAFGRL